MFCKETPVFHLDMGNYANEMSYNNNLKITTSIFDLSLANLTDSQYIAGILDYSDEIQKLLVIWLPQ